MIQANTCLAYPAVARKRPRGVEAQKSLQGCCFSAPAIQLDAFGRQVATHRSKGNLKVLLLLLNWRQLILITGSGPMLVYFSKV